MGTVDGSGKTPILGASVANAFQMGEYLRRINPAAPNYASLYLEIGASYGVRGDLAFAQSLKETGFWRFGGSVRAEQNNFAGLGATSRTEGGASFATPELGIEAQIQHLYGYATTAPLPGGRPIVDPRFSLLQAAGLRGTAPYWEDLNGKWAVPGTNYGQDIVTLWKNIQAMPASSGGGGTTPEPENPDAWKREALDWLVRMQLINSEHDPDAPVTWAEFGTVLRRLREGL
ncbi:glucosaminidase domain-containing protein [Paenibacillus flagellatus]|nr:glucosaminidase domain-containing protein [Paenibacillus flagellatus]